VQQGEEELKQTHYYPQDVVLKKAAMLTRAREATARNFEVIRLENLATPEGRAANVAAAKYAEEQGVPMGRTQTRESGGVPASEASGAPAADDFLAQHEQMMRSQGHSGGVSARQRRQMRASQRERANASRSRHPLAASRADAAGEEELVMQGDHTIQTCEVLASNVEGLALNAGGGDDYCPICWTPWGEFADSSTLAVVLPL
jgi:hypothetical protein